MMMSQAQFRGHPKFKPPNTPVGQWFEHRPRNAPKFPAPKSVPRDQMTRSQKRRWQRRNLIARRMKVEYSESTGLIGKSQNTDAKEQPREKEPEKQQTQDVDMKDSGTFKSEGKPRFALTGRKIQMMGMMIYQRRWSSSLGVFLQRWR